MGSSFDEVEILWLDIIKKIESIWEIEPSIDLCLIRWNSVTGTLESAVSPQLVTTEWFTEMSQTFIKMKQKDIEISETAELNNLHIEVDDIFTPEVEIQEETLSRVKKRISGFHVCDMCGVLQPDLKKLNKHVSKQHSDCSKVCRECDAVFESVFDLMIHRQLEHCLQLSGLQCQMCGLKFVSDRALKCHLIYKHSTDSNICFNCLEVLETFSDVQKHTENEHDNSWICPNPDCSIVLPTAEELAEHILQHRKRIWNERIKCDLCDFSTFTKSELRKHCSIEHTIKEICNICHKEFGNKSRLTLHIRTRHGSEKFTCKRCSKSFDTAQKLVKHSKIIHNDLKPFVCKEKDCENCYATYSRLLYHEKKWHRKKTFDKQCSTCNKLFTNDEGLRVHQKRCGVAASQAKFSCQICLKRFFTNHELNDHLFIHRSDRSFVCKICLKTFKLRTSLAAHVRTHSDKLPYTCSKCQTKFKNYHTARMHSIKVCQGSNILSEILYRKNMGKRAEKYNHKAS
ncbi:DgyrCDS11392 [Dimorphilus gyrociliatus]|uniref:DgyrCDS11392 n=1 Tax=Dimorphilus gyrociliatus TaxID=2664684 RepID=A0A7I8W363_9ANNE|nr:DgyrCDS11392 [Dimorphilus gyrociliatus]